MSQMNDTRRKARATSGESALNPRGAKAKQLGTNMACTEPLVSAAPHENSQTGFKKAYGVRGKESTGGKSVLMTTRLLGRKERRYERLCEWQ